MTTTAAYIARHQQEIASQRARMTPAAATSTLFLAGQRIRACEDAILTLIRRDVQRATMDAFRFAPCSDMLTRMTHNSSASR